MESVVSKVMKRISTSAFTFEVSDDDGGDGVLTLHGELDLSVAVEVRSLLETEIGNGRDITIHLSGLEFVDSTGLATLLRASEYAASEGHGIRLIGPVQDQVRRVLRLTGLNQALTVEE